MFDLSLPKLLVLAVIALVIFGPNELPTIASQAARALRDLRKIAEGAKNDLREGLGPELADFEIEDLNPKRHASHAGRAPAVRPGRDVSREFLVTVCPRRRRGGRRRWTMRALRGGCGTGQEIAACTSSATFFSTMGLHFLSAYATGHTSPSSRFAASWKPSVE